MTVTCATCANWDLKTCHLRQHALGLCKVHSAGKWHTFSGYFPRTCDQFSQAEPKVIAARTRALNPKEAVHEPT